MVVQTGLRRRERYFIERILQSVQALPPIGQRMKTISAWLLGYPYIANPLIGSATEPEVFVARLDGFDCVTFMETVLALASASNIEEFLKHLREIRYEGGEVAWQKRLHYTTEWAKYNIRAGRLANLVRGADAVTRIKWLNFLPDYPARVVKFRYFPKRKLSKIGRRLKDGDLIFFVSTRKGLDTFHTGLIFRDGDRLLLRHAARSRGQVVEQELTEFVKANRMSGFIVVRPREVHSAGNESDLLRSR